MSRELGTPSERRPETRGRNYSLTLRQREVHTINEETKDQVSSWARHAKALQEDIIRSKTIANDIVRQSEAPEVSGEAIEDAEEKVQFLNREVQYSQQIQTVLAKIKGLDELLTQVETAQNDRRVLEALRLLERECKHFQSFQ